MAASSLNNPQLILRTLDSHLEQRTRVVLFGRAALALGFGDSGARFSATQDVDAILPTVEMAKIESDGQFWKALEQTNKVLEPLGLYLTHLFTDKQVILTVDWLDKIVEIPSSDYKFLQLYRPSSVDLILTKMMRNDREDLDDVRFIVQQDGITLSTLDDAFSRAIPVETPEIRALFMKMMPLVRDVAAEMDHVRRSMDLENYIRYQSHSRSVEKEKDREMER